MGVVLVDRIVSEIKASGLMPFDRFMEMALYDPDEGFFTAGRLRSDRQGDFLTSPEVSPLFGETIARFVEAERERVGTPFTVAELGGGSGSLLRPLLGALGRPPDRVVAIEASPAARAGIAQQVPEAELIERLPEMRGVVIANEVMDNVPAALAVRRGTGWREQVVAADDEGLALVEVEPRSDAAAWADAYAGEVTEGGLVEVQLQAGGLLRAMIAAVESGAVVMFDYGNTADGLRHRRAEGTLRTYRSHHLGPDPLAEPGATDITMDVNFTALCAVAAESGAGWELSRQDDFLERWGLRDRLRRLRHDELAAARDGRTMERLMLRSRVTEVETLLHPRGLGDFRVLVVSR